MNKWIKNWDEGRMQIPLFDLNYDEREQLAVAETLASKWISSGPRCMELEERFAGELNARNACAVTNCTAALHLALMALGIGAGDEVIVPSLSFVATVNAVKYVGAEPVFCDVVSPVDLTIDPARMDDLITERTKAVLVMHYGGFACHMDRIMETARRHGLYVVEDACHGPLSEYHGKKLGTIGDIGCFSFFSNKNISSAEGGMIVTDNEVTARKMRLMRSHGMTTMSYERGRGHSTSYDVVELGYNYRLDDIRASLALVQLDKLRDDLEKRNRIRRQYEDELRVCEEVLVPFAGYVEYASNYIMPVVLKAANRQRRDFVRERLREWGIQTSVHYPAAHRFSIYESARRGNLSNTEYAADCEITLPMYGSLTEEQVRYICETLKDVVRRAEE